MEREKILTKKIGNQTINQHVLFHCIPFMSHSSPSLLHFSKRSIHFEFNCNGLVKHAPLNHL